MSTTTPQASLPHLSTWERFSALGEILAYVTGALILLLAYLQFAQSLIG